jgi:hypothetical protein
MTWLIIAISVVAVIVIALLAVGSMLAVAMIGSDDDYSIIEIDDVDLP